MTLPLESIGFQDFLRPEILANPYPLYTRLRHEEPVHRDPATQGWIATRYDDIAAVLSDRRFSAERLAPRTEQGGGMAEAVRSALARQMLFLDPPDHTRLRGLFAKAFNPRRLDALRPQVLETVTELLDRAEATGSMDFIPDFAIPLPVIVIAQMLGVPVEDRHHLRTWSVSFGRFLNGRALSADEAAEAQKGVLEFVDYFRKLIEIRRQNPQNDMLSDLITIEEEGQRLTLQELIVNLILLLAAGHGTTTHLLGNGLFALLTHREQWDLLVAEPEIVPSAITELLRFDAPVQATGREALEEMELGGKTIAAGERVTVFLGSANRDEQHFPNPDALDLRRPATRILSFGHGIHTCLGAALARMEAQIAFAELSRRYPAMQLQIDTPSRPPSITFRGIQSLPVALR